MCLGLVTMMLYGGYTSHPSGTDDFELLDGTDFLLLDNSNFLLLAT